MSSSAQTKRELRVQLDELQSDYAILKEQYDDIQNEFLEYQAKMEN